MRSAGSNAASGFVDEQAFASASELIARADSQLNHGRRDADAAPRAAS